VFKLFQNLFTHKTSVIQFFNVGPFTVKDYYKGFFFMGEDFFSSFSNMAIDYSSKIGLIFFFMVPGFIFLLGKSNKTFSEMFVILSVIAFLPLMGYETYSAVFIAPFFILVSAFGFMALNNFFIKKKILIHYALIALMILSLFFIFFMFDHSNAYEASMPENTYNSAQFIKLNANGTTISRDRFYRETGWSPSELFNKKVLECGSGAGRFTQVVLDAGAICFSFDYSNAVDVNLQNNSPNENLILVQADIYDIPFRKKTFDYIVMIYVLEHIAEPKQFLRSMKKLLKPKGKMVILVPNVQDALLNFYNIPEFRSFYYCIEHIFYYNPQTIKWLFDEVGLQGEIEIIQEYPLSNHLNWAYRRAPSDTLASRKGMPDIPLLDTALDNSWNELWNRFNQLYQTFLKDNGFGDRIWCTVGINK